MRGKADINTAKWGQMGPSGAKRGQTVLNFLLEGIFLLKENIATQTVRQK